jgi:hypothetical protein
MVNVDRNMPRLENPPTLMEAEAEWSQCRASG